jgi:PST family polysaccharide transporter
MPSHRHAINLLSLIAIQGANAILPLIVFPFALGVLGVERYGQIVQGEAIALFLLTFVLYSFEIEGVAAVVGCDPKRDTSRIAHEFSVVTYLRMILFAITAPIILVCVFFIDTSLIWPAAAWMLMPLSFAISPNWLYLGIERNFPLAITTLLSRALALAMVFFTVRGPHDQLRVPLSLGIPYCLGAVAASGIAMSLLGARFVRIAPSKLFSRLITGRDIFLGNLSVTLYRDLNVLLMGFWGAPSVAIASYSVAEKFAKALQATARPLNLFYFPKAIALAKAAATPSPRLFSMLFRLLIPLLATLSMFIGLATLAYILFSKALLILHPIQNSDRIALLVAIMSGATLAGVSNNVLGAAGLNTVGLSRYYFLSIAATGVANLAIASVMILQFSDVGAAISFVVAELILFGLVARRFLRPHKEREL